MKRRYFILSLLRLACFIKHKPKIINNKYNYNIQILCQIKLRFNENVNDTFRDYVWDFFKFSI